MIVRLDALPVALPPPPTGSRWVLTGGLISGSGSGAVSIGTTTDGSTEVTRLTSFHVGAAAIWDLDLPAPVNSRVLVSILSGTPTLHGHLQFGVR